MRLIDSAVKIREKMTIGCNFPYSFTKYIEESKFIQLFNGKFVKKSVLSKKNCVRKSKVKKSFMIIKYVLNFPQ